MKKVLILGANSYIGNSFQKYIGENYNDQYEVHKVSLRGEAWKEDDWSGYDSILNVTGKAHADIGILTEEQKQEYYAVNCDLTCEAAQKAVKDGVGQYIYLSSVIVYGDSSNGGGAIHITKDTKPAPSNFYGDSKWQAEQKLQVLFEELKEDDGKNNTALAIVRPPMIYGKNSKGNFKNHLMLCFIQFITIQCFCFFQDIYNGLFIFSIISFDRVRQGISAAVLPA